MKEYITDTMSLRGISTLTKPSGTSKVSQITTTDIVPGKALYSVISSQLIKTEGIEASAKLDVSIGGFVDSTQQFQDLSAATSDKIKIYTGEAVDFNKVFIYPGKERFTINKKGYVGINNSNIDVDTATLDIRSTFAQSSRIGFTPPLETPVLALTHPYYNNEASKPATPQFIGSFKFRSIQAPGRKGEVARPTDMAGIEVETNGEANVYEDSRVNLNFRTLTGTAGSRALQIKHFELNGYENKTKVFTQLNLGFVPVFRDSAEAGKAGLVSGDVWQDRLQNLKIYASLAEGKGAKIE